MSAPPSTDEELRASPFFQAGQKAKRNRIPLARAISCLRPGCWQYEAFISGYDASKIARLAALANKENAE